jgi:hypothetical protein
VAVAADEHGIFAPAKIDQRSADDYTVREEEEHGGEPADFHGEAEVVRAAGALNCSYSFKLARITDGVAAIGATGVGTHVITGVGDLVTAVTAAAVENGRVHGDD